MMDIVYQSRCLSAWKREGGAELMKPGDVEGMTTRMSLVRPSRRTDRSAPLSQRRHVPGLP